MLPPDQSLSSDQIAYPISSIKPATQSRLAELVNQSNFFWECTNIKIRVVWKDMD